MKEFDVRVPHESETCEPCIYGKAHKLTFRHREKCSKPGELISAIDMQ